MLSYHTYQFIYSAGLITSVFLFFKIINAEEVKKIVKVIFVFNALICLFGVAGETASLFYKFNIGQWPMWIKVKLLLVLIAYALMILAMSKLKHKKGSLINFTLITLLYLEYISIFKRL